MWIASKLGFFSIVAHREKRGHFLVRARIRGDLENLLSAFRGPSTTATFPVPQIVEMADADYRYRITVRGGDFAGLLLTLEASVDYDNFKNAVQAQPEQREKVPAYLQLWSKLRQLQPVR